MADFDSSKEKPERTDKFLEIKIITDGYRGHELRISHWLQKDGIQNCWDAIKSKNNKDKKWKCVFELHENIAVKNDATGKVEKRNFVTITDYGTHGLTGKVLADSDLLKNLDLNERWGRFENYAFKNELPKGANAKHLLGSRGRGKYVFIGASKMTPEGTKMTFYETLRNDGIYRIGRRKVERLGSKTIHAEETDTIPASQILKDQTGMSPITHVGTRIIIPDPEDEVIEDFKDGTISGFISETWWEIIEKYGAEIIVKVGGKEIP